MKTFISAAAASLVLAASAISASSASELKSPLLLSTEAVRDHSWKQGVDAAGVALKLPLTSPQALVAYTNLCIGLTNLGQFDAATDACNKSIEVAPDHWTGYLNRGSLEAAMGHAVLARADYETAKSFNPHGTQIARAETALVFQKAIGSDDAFFAALLPPPGSELPKQVGEAK